MDERSTALLTDERLASLAAYSGAPWTPENAYFAKAEAHMAALWERMVWPFIFDCDFTEVVDLAAGHGRNTVFLLKVADHITITDIQPGNVAVCRSRFDGEPRVTAFVANGYDFRPLADSSITLVYCFDAMVHFDSDVVRSYLSDARRILRPGGRAFLHHSNYIGGHDWRTNPAARNFMSKELFEHYALKENLRVVRQSVINWGSELQIDCLSMIERPA